MLVNLKTLVDDAYKGKYAYGSFNGYNLETFSAAIDAGLEKNQSVIVAFGAKYLDNMSLKTAKKMIEGLVEDIDINVCFHLDHCDDMQIIKEAIDLSFGSVMYDGSRLPFEENLANTKKVCELAHANNVSVEAELGSLAAGKDSHEGLETDKEVYTDPVSAKRFVEETGVDCLAVSIGTVHGMYQGTPKIRVDILKEINEQCQIPLVLHGGSGTPEEDILECIQNGITKINVNTELSNEALAYTRENVSDIKHYSVLSLGQRKIIKEKIESYMSLYRK